MAVTEKKPPTQAQLDARAANGERLRKMAENRKQLNAAASRVVTNEEVFSANFANRTAESTEDLAAATATVTQGLSNIGSVTHRGPINVRMYDAKGNMRFVPSSNVQLLLRHGFYPVCPICGSQHAEKGFNACSGKEPLLYTACPVCAQHGKRRLIPDERLEEQVMEMTNDPNFFVSDIGVGRDAKERIRVRLEAHIIDKHQATAQAMGLLRQAAPAPR